MLSGHLIKEKRSERVDSAPAILLDTWNKSARTPVGCGIYGRQSMVRNQEILGFNGMSARIPDAGLLLDAQRAAAENTARMASTACHYTMSLNRAWLEFWSKHLTQYTELPKRFAEAQTDFMERAFGHYQDSIRQFSSITEEAQEELQEAAEESGKAGERVAQRLMDEAKEMSKPVRSKESRQARATEQQREQAH